VADGLIALLAKDDVPLAATWRDIAVQQLVHALRSAGRNDEVTELLERQAEQSGNVLALASHLIDIGDLENAECRLRAAADAETSPLMLGMSLHREMQHRVYERQGDRQRLASFHADRF